MIIGIHQPNFFPWFGYFAKIVRSDVFVFLDDVQLVKTGGSYTNRTYLNIQGKAKYFTLPIIRTSGTQLINQSHFKDNGWKKKLIETLKVNYVKAPYWKDNNDFLFELIGYQTDNLSEFNVHSIKEITNYLGLKCTFLLSSSLSVPCSSTERLIEIVKKLHGDTYLSGKGAEKYQDESLFEQNHIHLIYNEFKHPLYRQLNTEEFIGGLSIIDLLFNLGKEEVRENLLIISSNNYPFSNKQ